MGKVVSRLEAGRFTLFNSFPRSPLEKEKGNREEGRTEITHETTRGLTSFHLEHSLESHACVPDDERKLSLFSSSLCPSLLGFSFPGALLFPFIFC